MKEKIRQVVFLCTACKLGPSGFPLRPRYTNEAFQHWFEEVAEDAWVMHRILSPVCTQPSLQMALPVQEATRLFEKLKKTGLCSRD